MEKRTLEQYAQCMRESEDLRNRIRIIDAEIQGMDAEAAAVSMGSKGSRALGKAIVHGKGRAYSDRKTALLQLRLSYEKMQDKLAAMAVNVEEYIQGIDDSRMRQIMRLRYTDTRKGRQLTWLEIARQMHETEDSCRKAHDRWIRDDMEGKKLAQ